MALREYTGTKQGDIPWAMDQNQRGPTCGMTAISVAYRILTGWTIFPTKGHFRDFQSKLYGVKINKGDENAYVLRKAAKDLEHTVAGEIVNADSLVELIRCCEGVDAETVPFEDNVDVGEKFLQSVRKDILAGNVPIVLFHVGLTLTEGQYKPHRGEKYQHWVAIFGAEEGRKWSHLQIKHLTPRMPLKFTDNNVEKDALLVWNWGKPYIVGGVELGKSSALSIDWATGKPRMWEKEANKPGQLAWLEWTGTDPQYIEGSKLANHRYTVETANKSLDLRGYVRVFVK